MLISATFEDLLRLTADQVGLRGVPLRQPTTSSCLALCRLSLRQLNCESSGKEIIGTTKTISRYAKAVDQFDKRFHLVRNPY